MTHYVYGMADPLQCATIRYVGYTALSPETRLQEQITAARNAEYHSPKSQWINSIIRMDRRPTIIILQYCANRREGLTAEKFWIVQGQLLGWELFNIHGFEEDYKPLKNKRKPESKPELSGDGNKLFPVDRGRSLTAQESEMLRKMVRDGKFDRGGKPSITAMCLTVFRSKNPERVAWIKEALG